MPGELVLSRHNKPLVRACLEIRAKGKRAYIRGVNLTQRVLSTAREIPNLWQHGERALERATLEEGGEGIDLLRALLRGGLSNETQLVRILEDLERPTPGAVQLATLHRSKGLESPFVTVIGLEEHDETERDLSERQQDLNAKYVGLTRTKSEGGGRLTLAGTPGEVAQWLTH